MTDHHQSLREATAKTPQTAWGLVPASLLKHIYASDQAIYPAPDLSFARLQSWAAACPELFLCLANENTDASHQAINSDPGAAFDGVIIVLPLLRDAWEALLTGHVREHDIDPARMFPPTMNGKMEGFFEVGLHVFHVERFAGRSRSGFAALALEKVKSVAEQFRGWDVVGYSALTATPQGNAAFKRLGFTITYAEEATGAEMAVRRGTQLFGDSVVG